jgi:hypothetical protein
MQDVICPVHKVALTRDRSYTHTPWSCPVQGCTVAWWSNPNTIPADYETRQARIKAHAAIDPIWRNRRMSRYTLYRKMKKELGVEHIGLCDTQTCERIIEWTNTL